MIIQRGKKWRDWPLSLSFYSSLSRTRIAPDVHRGGAVAKLSTVDEIPVEDGDCNQNGVTQAKVTTIVSIIVIHICALLHDTVMLFLCKEMLSLHIAIVVGTLDQLSLQSYGGSYSF